MASFGTTVLFDFASSGQAFTCDSGTTRLLIGMFDGNGALDSVSYNSIAGTSIVRATSSEGNVSWWVIEDPTTGASHNITFSGPGGSFPALVAAVPIIGGAAVVGSIAVNQNASNPMVTGSFDTGNGGVAVMISRTVSTDSPVTAYGTGESALGTAASASIRVSGKSTDGSATTMSHTRSGAAFWASGAAVSIADDAPSGPTPGAVRAYRHNQLLLPE